MSGVQRHALTYFGTAGLLTLLLSGGLILILVKNYNQDRVIDLGLAAVALISYATAQALLITAVTTYIATRKGYAPPPMPQIPKAKTVALIPAYNEAGRVGKIVEEARKYVDLVIVVDDGSIDSTAEEAQRAGAVVIRHHANMGYGAAVKTLLHAALKAEAEYAVLLDADGQHDPRDIPKFLKALKTADIAIGNRFAAGKTPTYRAVGIKTIKTALKILGIKAEDPENGYRAFTRKAIETLLPALEETWMGISSQTVFYAAKKKLKIASVPTAVTYGPDTSTESPLKHGLSIIWSIIWTTLTYNPQLTAGLAAGTLATSIGLILYAVHLFNSTRYIRLTYTALALILETVAVILTAITITKIITQTKQRL